MVNESEIILREILKKGYKSVQDFCVKNGIERRNIHICFQRNRWNEKNLIKIGEILGVDLKSFANAKKGKEDV